MTLVVLGYLTHLAQLVDVIAPMVTTHDGLLLQTTFHPFELHARTYGDVALGAARRHKPRHRRSSRP